MIQTGRSHLQISKNKGRKMFLLQPAQLRELKWWRNLGPQPGPTHVCTCIVSGPLFHLGMWGKARRTSPPERGSSVASKGAGDHLHVGAMAHLACRGTLCSCSGHAGLRPAARTASGCAVRRSAEPGCWERRPCRRRNEVWLASSQIAFAPRIVPAQLFMRSGN